MASKPSLQQLAAENQGLRARLEKAEESLREILSGEADALFVTGVGGAQLFALKGADQSYRTLIENMSEGALTLTPEGLILYANRRFAEMLRTPLEKVIGSHIHTWFSAASRQVVQTLLRNDAVDNRREELALVAADGKQVPVNLSVSHLVLDGMPDFFCMVATDLTEQKRNEAILAAEKLSSAILEQAADAIVICDETGRITRASKRAQAFCGTSPLGQHFEHAFPLRESDCTVFSPIGDIDSNPRQLVEASLERNGQRFDLLVSVGHLKGPQNELLGSVVTLTDITERKKTELVIQKSEKQLSEALTLARIGYWEYEFSTDEFTFNDQYYLLHRITAEQAGGYRMSSAEFSSRYVHPEDAPIVGHHVRLAFDSLDPDYFAKTEVRILTGDGEIVWVDVRMRIQKDLRGNTIRLFGVNQDVTERKRATHKLRESERRLDGIITSAMDAILTVDEEQRIVLSNPAAERMFGYTAAELQGQPLGLLMPESSRTGHAANIAAFGKAGITSRRMGALRPITGVRKSGEEFPIEASISTDKSTGPRLFTAILRDITERAKSEARIFRLNRVLGVLSGINTLIVRARDRDELFREACRIAVETGGFRLAWIGLIDRDTMELLPVAAAGSTQDADTLVNQRFSLNDETARGNTMSARAIREKTPVFTNDVSNDPAVVFKEELAKRGSKSLAFLPLLVAGEAEGVLALCSAETGFFDDEELKLLTELAGDIGFAIDHISKQARLDYLAYYDVLTGLANRRLFFDRVAQHMRSSVTGGHQLALFLIDLERFKNINDSLGRPAGDVLLKQVAERLTRDVGDPNLLANLGADHFAILLPKVRPEGDLTRLLERRMSAFLDHPFHLEDAVLRISFKVGVALFPDDGADVETLFRNAEAALKLAKSSGERYLFYTQTMTAMGAGKLTMENQLRQALDNKEFVLHYQPKVNLASGKLTSAEALIRWNDPLTGLVPPGRFIPILEETGLIYEVGRWALRQAIADYLRWRAAGLPAVRIAVNVSPLQLRNRNFIDEIAQVIGIDPQAADGLELEITESLIMEDVKHSIASLQAIRDMGICIAIDDFGTGFSSLSYLARLPVHTLKIDRSFVVDMTAGPQGLALVSTIISLAHALQLKVVAEGVETEEQQRLLRLLNCDEMQGYLFSRPVPAEIFEARFLAPPTAK